MIERVYDAFMAILWRNRSVVCLLLAVSTAIGGIAPARACDCATPAKTPSIPVKERAAPPQHAIKSCCEPNAKKRACCPSASTGGTAKASCCDNKVPCERPGTPSPTPTDSAGCHCVRCDCDPPGAPPAPAAPAPAISDLDEHAVASLVPPVLIPGPPLVSWRPAQLVPASPPADLVISLSRLTC